jgi:hypothetical protein
MRQNKISNLFRIRIRLPDNAKRDLTKKLLDWAERQKPAKETNWFLLELQQHRHLQRELADSLYKDTRPPEGTTINFLGFRLVEIFHYEDFEKVRLGLKSLFPILSNEEDDFIKDLEKISDAITTGMWHPVGTLYGDKPVGFLGARVSRNISTIHSTIESIDVEIQKMTPSLMAVSFDVHLKEIATSQLIELHSQKYFGKSGAAEIHIGRYPNVGITLRSPESAMVECINDWISTIRENVEETIKPYLPGYFLSKDSNKHHLPSIEAYSLSRAQSQQRNFVTWAHLANRWLHSLGFSLSPRNWFGNSELVFNWRSSERNTKFNRANRIFIFAEEFSGQPASMRQTLKYLLVEITPLIAIVEFLGDAQGVLERLRRHMFNAMGKKYDLTRHIQLYQNFQVLGLTIQRLNLEIEKRMAFFWGNNFFDTSKLVKVKFSKESKRTRKSDDVVNITSDGQERIKTLYELLSDQIMFIDKVFSSQIEILNVDAVYRLQKITLWLTIVATIAGVVSVLLNFTELSKLFQNLLKFFAE